ncbi:thiamine/thiamine pyrophosphate ABC transporter permease ThiP [Vibrio sp. AK197]
MNSTPKTGIGVAFVIAALVIAALSALLMHAPLGDISFLWQDSYYRHVTQFSFYQAFLSMLLSVGGALPVALALSRRHFAAKSWIIKIFGTTLVMPVLVGVFGLLAIYGNSGLVAKWLERFDFTLPFSIYGLGGILLAHVFFNLPYATRLLYQSLETIPGEQHKLCAHLGMSAWDKFKWVEWPRLRQQLPSVCGLVFMLCFTSFATVMALGGGPKSTTIELAIYQAIKFDFDLQSGALLAMWQMLLCGTLALSIQRFAKPLAINGISYRQTQFKGRESMLVRVWDMGVITITVIFVFSPLLMVFISGISSAFFKVLADSEFWSALGASLQVAVMSSGLALSAGIAILSTSRRWRVQDKNRRANGIEMLGAIILITPGLVLSTGLFVLLRQFTDVFQLAWLIVVVVNALMGLPYVIKTLAQPMLHVEQQYQYLCASLGLKGWQRFRVVEWRALHKPVAQALSICFMFAIGDLSAIALFGSQEFKTLPLYLFQLLGSYQMASAAVVSVVMLLLSIGVFSLVEWLIKPRKASLMASDTGLKETTC